MSMNYNTRSQEEGTNHAEKIWSARTQFDSLDSGHKFWRGGGRPPLTPPNAIVIAKNEDDDNDADSRHVCC